MDLLTHNPAGGVYAATPDDAHALEVRGASRTLFVSGTMGLDAAALGGRLVPTTAIVAETLAEDWLVELEVIAIG
jgi:enamine deaminase RidA (YjgF/YER057c/UK114 family)